MIFLQKMWRGALCRMRYRKMLAARTILYAFRRHKLRQYISQLNTLFRWARRHWACLRDLPRTTGDYWGPLGTAGDTEGTLWGTVLLGWELLFDVGGKMFRIVFNASGLKSVAMITAPINSSR